MFQTSKLNSEIKLPYPTKIIVQWGPNQNGVFEIVVKEISMLLTLTAS